MPIIISINITIAIVPHILSVEFLFLSVPSTPHSPFLLPPPLSSLLPLQPPSHPTFIAPNLSHIQVHGKEGI